MSTLRLIARLFEQRAPLDIDSWLMPRVVSNIGHAKLHHHFPNQFLMRRYYIHVRAIAAF